MNITHIKHLFRAYFIENKKMLLVCSLIVFAASALDLTLSYEAELSAILCCFIPLWIAGRFFQSSLKRNNSTHFFNLPVNTLEKTIFAIVLTVSIALILGILYNVGAYFGYYLLRPILNPNASSIFEKLHQPPILDFSNLKPYFLYVAALFTFLFGSIYFKKNAFWKTFASLIGFFTAIAIYQLVLLYIAFGNFRDFFVENPSLEINNLNFNSLGESYFIPIIFILFFLSLTYLRLRETEV